LRPRIRFSRRAKTYQTGFELTPAPLPAVATDGQLDLFEDDCSQPDSADGEPIFWSADAGPSGADDGEIQPDAPA